ncbi:MAG: hypothetical protein IJ706_02215 [Clostridia bacterium]|nr:hypothetical protein [Clostridia bacterium]
MRTKCGYTLNKQELNKWLKDNGYTYGDLVDELEIESDYFEDTLANGCDFDEDIIIKLIKFTGAENAFKIINFKNREEKDRVFYETFVKPIEEHMGYKWQKKG